MQYDSVCSALLGSRKLWVLPWAEQTCSLPQATPDDIDQWVQASAVPAEDAARDTGEHWAWQESLEVEPAPLKEIVLAELVAVPVRELWALLFRVRHAGRS